MLKFKRTYIGGTKINEDNLFNKVQGTNDDDCDLLTYKRILDEYFNDKLLINKSYRFTFKYLGYLFAIISLFLLLSNKEFFLHILIISIVLQLLSLFFKKRYINESNMFNASKSLLNTEIQNKMGF
jgi:hypothetical protein